MNHNNDVDDVDDADDDDVDDDDDDDDVERLLGQGSMENNVRSQDVW